MKRMGKKNGNQWQVDFNCVVKEGDRFVDMDKS